MPAEDSPCPHGMVQQGISFLLSLDNIPGGVYQSGLPRYREVWDPPHLRRRGNLLPV